MIQFVNDNHNDDDNDIDDNAVDDNNDMAETCESPTETMKTTTTTTTTF